MFDSKSLEELGPITNEMLGGLEANEAMRLKIVRAAAEGGAVRRAPARRFVPAICCAALVLGCVSVAGLRPDKDIANTIMLTGEPETVSINTIAAGEGAAYAGSEMMADLGDNARVRTAPAAAQSLFVQGSGDIPLVAMGSAIYQMLETPMDIGSSLLGGSVGSVQLYDEQPSLASPREMSMGLSNVAETGTAVYAVKGVPDSTMVACEVNGSMRVFQRVSYAGKGPAGASFEETFGVRGKVKSAELSGVGTLKGEKANEVIAVLLDNAVLKSADASARRQTLTVTLENGLKLQLGVSGDTLCACGGWSCPEFFEAFEAAL